jgi:hypothetical protein
VCDVVTVIFGVCNSVRPLYLLLVAIHKWSINPESNPKPRRESLKIMVLYIYIYEYAKLIFNFISLGKSRSKLTHAAH